LRLDKNKTKAEKIKKIEKPNIISDSCSRWKGVAGCWESWLCLPAVEGAVFSR